MGGSRGVIITIPDTTNMHCKSSTLAACMRRITLSDFRKNSPRVYNIVIVLQKRRATVLAQHWQQTSNLSPTILYYYIIFLTCIDISTTIKIDRPLTFFLGWLQCFVNTLNEFIPFFIHQVVYALWIPDSVL